MTQTAQAARTIRCLAFDFGAGSGRAVVAELAEGRLTLTEIHRSPGVEVQGDGGPCWDMAAMLGHVETGLAAAADRFGAIDSVGVDAWGLDFGLLDRDGRLLAAPAHYRHDRSRRGHLRAPVADDWLAAQTGAQVLEGNTVFQLCDLVHSAPDTLGRAHRLLMIADLVNFHLTGVARSDVTLARTTGMHTAGRDH